MIKFSNRSGRFIRLALIFIPCCGDGDASTWDHRSSELVLGDRQAFTGRLLTTTDTDINVRLSQQRFQEAMLTRASGGAYVATGTAACKARNSSVSLMGDFTLLGSAHALGDDVGVETVIDIAFENQTRFPDVSNTLATAGDFQVYLPSYSPEDLLVQTYLSKNADDVGEESPFLAERLFQLGFQKEGFENQDPRSDISNPDMPSRLERNTIRYSWRAAVDLDSQTAASTYKVDAVTLSVLPLDLIEFLERRAGVPGVEFKSPAPFFNRVTMKSHVLKGDDPLWLTHFKPLHPTEQIVAGSILTTGNFRNKVEISLPINDFKICGTGEVVPQEELHLTDLDAYEQSSGGGVYGCTYEKCGVPAGDGNEDPDNFGVLRLAGLMAEVWTVDPNDKLMWGNSVPFSADNHTRAHMFTKDQVKAYAQPREDKIINCTNSIPASACFRYPDCLIVNPSGYCEEWENGQFQENNFGDPSHFDVVTIDEAIDEEQDRPPLVVGKDNGKNLMYSVNCNTPMRFLKADLPSTLRGSKVKSMPGAMVGLRAFPAVDSAGNLEGIGTFRPVCAPMDPEPYSSNWRFLRSLGVKSIADSQDDANSIARAPGLRFYYRLYEALLSEGYRERTDRTERLRPVPMKMCPPGTQVRGMRYEYDNTAQITEISGLVCKPNKAYPNSGLGARDSFIVPTKMPLIQVPLPALPTDDIYYYSLGGYQYSLSQNLGYSRPGTQTNTTECSGDDEVVTKVGFTYGLDGRVSRLFVGCIDAVM